MNTYVLVSDPRAPNAPAWWMAVLPQGDHDALINLHQLFARFFLIRDGNDPHMQAARKQEDPVAIIQHPRLLAAAWLRTAINLFSRSDVLVSSKGGMRPRDNSLTYHKTLRAEQWPGTVNPTRRIAIKTWGTHYYLTCLYMAFHGKHNTEEEAMAEAKLYALPENIRVERVAKSYRDGD